MYKIKETVYADAGYLLLGNRQIGFQLNGELTDFIEEAVTLDDMHIENNTIICNNGKLRWSLHPDATYADLKRWVVRMRYSNDDQIAVILNKDDSPEDGENFHRMRVWREWASTVAHKILTL